MSAPALGLLLDVDGPIASPVTRTVRIPSILDDLVAMTAAGVPVAFVTGRSDVFIDEVVVRPLLDRGLAAALSVPGARMYGVFEKGASWAPITASGMGEVTVDQTVAFAPEAKDAVRSLVERDFAEWLFYDETKRAMISVEHHTSVDAADFPPIQARFQDAAYELLTVLGIGLRYGERSHADAAGNVPFRVDPTVISTDIESVLLDKDRGAERALDAFAVGGPLPSRWLTVGDSRSDYKMSDQLHADGYDVAHVDVRPGDGILDKPYRVITLGDLIHDDAGAALLHREREALGI